jgi:hypothetical protein
MSDLDQAKAIYFARCDEVSRLAERFEEDEVIDLILRGILAERERAAQVCEKQSEIFGSDEYATGQPLSSFEERFACDECANAIREGQP